MSESNLPNVIILTHGWSGSSLLTALLVRAGYWEGEGTVKKTDYDTHENADLVDMNRKMMTALEYSGDHEHHFDRAEIDALAETGARIDMAPYQSFLDACIEQQPWIWKDPRLTWTIRTWSRILPIKDVRFIILTREPMQAWITANLRRHIQSWGFTREYNDGITASLREFVAESGQDCIEMSFEDLLVRPEKTIEKLNVLLGVSLELADLEAVCRQPLYRKSQGVTDFIRAGLIFFKNFHLRR